MLVVGAVWIGLFDAGLGWLVVAGSGVGVSPDDAETTDSVKVDGGDSEIEPQFDLAQSSPRDALDPRFDLGDLAFGLSSLPVSVEELGVPALRLGRGVRQVATAVEAEHGACRVLTNLGRYQDSKHLHFHVNSGKPNGQEID